MHEQGWLYLGHRSTEWCPRCGTSLSQHELSQAGVYQERSDPSLFVRLPLLDRRGESLVVWTTTPWTLPANVAAAVKPDAEYGLHEDGEWTAVERYPDAKYVRKVRGEELVGWRYRGPFDNLAPGSAVEHRVIPWDEVTLDQGTGIVHIAPGAGPEDFELSRVHDLPVLTPVDEAGRFYDDYGWLHGKSTVEAADQIVGDLKERGLLVEATTYLHSYPHCWRCDTPLIFRIADDWFIAVDELRPKLLDANATVQWTPAYFGKRMDDWLRNMGDWNISRRRYFGLPLPIWRCGSGHVNVIGSKAELGERATAGMDQLEELHRPWVDAVTIRCAECGEEARARPRGRRRLARRGHRARSRRSGGRTPSGSRAGTRPAPRGTYPAPTCPTTRTGSSGSRPTGSRRCASRSGCGSTRSSSCRSRWWGARRFGRCSATRRCSTSTGARCTARGGT